MMGALRERNGTDELEEPPSGGSAATLVGCSFAAPTRAGRWGQGPKWTRSGHETWRTPRRTSKSAIAMAQVRLHVANSRTFRVRVPGS